MPYRPIDRVFCPQVIRARLVLHRMSFGMALRATLAEPFIAEPVAQGCRASPWRDAMNEALVTMIGYVASKPRLFETKGGRFVTNMRVGVTPRLQDRETGQWSDGDTSYVTVTCWRSLATNVAACLRKGDPIVVKGRMRVREYEGRDGNRRTVVEVDASTLGHDLNRGVAHFLRTKRSLGEAPIVPAGAAPIVPAGQQDARDIAGERSGAQWPDSVPDEGRPASAHVPDGDFSAADLFDDAEIEASAVAFVKDGGEPASVDADDDDLGDLSGQPGSDAGPSAERIEKAAA